MALSINEELRRVFELATLRREATSITEPHQWQAATRLQMRCTDARSREKDLYAVRYDRRVEARRRSIVDEAGKVRRDHRPWGEGHDRFDPQATLRQAHNDVRNAHAARIQRVDDYERLELARIVERARRENAIRGLATDDFQRAADRRAGPDRRVGPSR